MAVQETIWNGGECPVDPHTKVEVRFRGAVEFEPPYMAGALRWSHTKTRSNPGNGDIVAYRITEPPMSDFNAGLEAAAKVAESHKDTKHTATLDDWTVTIGKRLSDAILALRRPDAPDAVREALTEIAERCEQAAHPGAPVCLTALHVDHLKQIAGRARQALGGK